MAGECCPLCPGAGESGTHWEGVSVKRTQDVPTPPDPVARVCGKTLTRSTKATLCGIGPAPGLSQALSSLFKGWPNILESSERKREQALGDRASSQAAVPGAGLCGYSLSTSRGVSQSVRAVVCVPG